MSFGVGTDNDNSQHSWDIISVSGVTYVARRISIPNAVGVTGSVNLSGVTQIAAGTFLTPISQTLISWTVNSRLHQQWSQYHDITSGQGSDNHFYPQNMNTFGDVFMDMAAIKGTRVSVNSGTSDNGTQRVVLATGTTVSVGGTVDTELPAAAALSDSTGNPTAPMVGAAIMGWDEGGSLWGRARLISTIDGDTDSTFEKLASITWQKPASGGSVRVKLDESKTDVFSSATGGTLVDSSANPMTKWAFQVSCPGATIWNVQLLGSLNGTTFVTILTHSSTSDTNGDILFTADKPLSYFYANCVTLQSGLTLSSYIVGKL